jgi:hypothetical protein
MTPQRKVWTVLAVLYAVFFYWYTPFGGPLTSAEIEQYVEQLERPDSDPDRIAVWRRFMESDTGGDFAMANYIRLRETPTLVEGVAEGDTSQDVLRRYTEPFMREAFLDAAHPVFLGRAANDALDLWGIENADTWSIAGLVRYRSRRDVMNQALKVRAAGTHRFKLAAMEQTIAFPVDPWFHMGDPRLLLAFLFLVVGLALNLRTAKKQAA